MIYRKLGGMALKVSGMGLGTVELGCDYGLRSASVSQRPSRRQAMQLLHRALDLGVTFIDTAHDYGEAESLIGEAVAAENNVVLATKSERIFEITPTLRGTALTARILCSAENSLHRLRRDTIDLFQLHNPPAEAVSRDDVLRALDDLTQRGLVRYAGVAGYGEEVALAAIRCGRYQSIQVAYNLLDQRMARKVIPQAYAAGMAVIARSVLLKGVLTPKRAYLPEQLSRLSEKGSACEAFAASLGLSQVHAAIRFVLSDERISTALVGTANLSHLEEAVTVSDGNRFSESELARARALEIGDDLLLDPRAWQVS